MSYLLGKRFGLWVVTGESEPKIYGGKRFEAKLCKCECGTIRSVAISALLSGKSKSCGCTNSKSHIRHGKSTHDNRHPLYNMWANMKARCFREKHPSYPNYGGRGIKVCSEWLIFENFYEWAVSNGYQKGLWIDRIDNDADYSPENCRFATVKKQQNNKRTNTLIAHKGQTKNLTQWAEQVGIKPQTLIWRIRKWGVEAAIETPRISK